MTQNTIDAMLPRDRTCAARARRLLEDGLSAVLARPAVEDVMLVVSELVDNAYLHGQGEIRLRVEHQPETLLVEVMDQGRGAALQIREEAASLGGGYGLRIVEQLARRWGTCQGSTHVWAELPL